MALPPVVDFLSKTTTTGVVNSAHNLMELGEFLTKTPVVPFIREADFAVRKPWSVARRRLLDYLLIYVREGHCTVECNGIEHQLSSGDFCLLQPQDLIELRGTTNTVTPFAHFDIFYNVQRDDSFPTPPGLVDLTPYEHLVQPRLNDFSCVEVPVHIVPSNAVWFREVLLKMVGVWQCRDPLALLEAQNLAAELVLSILKDCTAVTPLTSSPQSLKWITPYLLLHLDEVISVEDMAAHARLSPSRFAAVFRAHHGLAPHQYLLHLRIGHAQGLLTRSDETLETIARFCGFANVHHFAKTFKKMTGLTPGAYRKQDTG